MWFTESSASRIGRITTTADPAVTILGKRASAAGSAAIELACAAASRVPCVGKLVLTTKIRGPEPAPGSKRTRAVTRTVTAGSSGRFEIAAGQRAKVKVTLMRIARSRLNRLARGRLVTEIRALSTGGDVRLTLTRAR